MKLESAADTDILYTLDGSTPTLSSQKYKSVILLPVNASVKAVAVNSEKVLSETAEYLCEKKILSLSALSAFNLDVDNKLLLGVTEKQNAAQIKANLANSDVVISKADGTPINDSEYVGTGSTVRLMSNGAILDEITVVVKGDTNGDCNVNVTDLVHIFNHIQETSLLTGAYRNAALINSDTKINVSDLVILFNQIQN